MLSAPILHKVKNITEKRLAVGIIEPSTSYYSSPAFLTGQDSLVINFSELNKRIQKVNFPIGDFMNYHQHLLNSNFYTVIDLTKSFLQFPLDDSSKNLIAFSLMHGKYQFTRVPFGLQLGSSILSSYLDKIFSVIKYEFMLHFCDDIVISSKDSHSHL